MIFHSTDGGMTWNEERWQSWWYPRDMYPITNHIAFVHVKPTYSTSTKGLYIVTTDGGSSWETAFDMDLEGKDWNSIYFTSSKVWYATRTPSINDSTVILRTEDGGVSWKPVLAGIMDRVRFTSTSGKHTYGEDTLWMVCSRGVLATLDGGESWSQLNVEIDASDIRVVDISGYPDCYLFARNTIAVSNDAGITWKYDSLYHDNLKYQQIIKTGNETVYLHYNEWNGRWRLLKSTNSGRSWDSIDIAQRDILICNIHADGSSYGLQTFGREYYVSSKDEWRTISVQGEYYGGPRWKTFSNDYDNAWVTTAFSILRTTNGGINWTNVTPSIPQSPRIISTWPQPVSQGGMMSTEVDLTRPGPVKIELYDLLGRRRAVVCDAEVTATRRTVQWSTAGLERGVYVLRLVTGDGVASGKVVVN